MDHERDATPEEMEHWTLHEIDWMQLAYFLPPRTAAIVLSPGEYVRLGGALGDRVMARHLTPTERWLHARLEALEAARVPAAKTDVTPATKTIQCRELACADQRYFVGIYHGTFGGDDGVFVESTGVLWHITGDTADALRDYAIGARIRIRHGNVFKG